MTISPYGSTMPNVSLAPAGTLLAGSNPLLGAAMGVPAATGVPEQPGFGSRVVSAVKAAANELRGVTGQDPQLLAMQAGALPTSAMPAALAGPGLATAAAPVQIAKPPVAAKPMRAVSAKQVVSAKTWKSLAQPPQPAAAQPATATATAAAAALPANASQLPGATVYSYDGSGNPAVAGLQGLTPTMQQQFGISPQALSGIDAMTQRVDPAGPQSNMTNQTALNGLGSGVGMPGYGTATPVLGAPIAMPPRPVAAPVATQAAPVQGAPVQGAPAPPSPGVSTPVAADGANQAVTNRNVSDTEMQNQGFGSPWGYSTGAWDPSGGIASPYSPYGASMNGSWQKPSLLQRLLG